MAIKRVVKRANVIDAGNVPYIDIMCAGDLHIGEANRAQRYMGFISDWVNEEPNRYLILDGDIFNAAIQGSKSDIYTETMTLDDAISSAVEWLSGIGDKLVISVSGNHDQRVQNAVGIDPVAHASFEAGVHYDGLEAYTVIKVGHDARLSHKTRRPVNYSVFCTHGFGNGSRTPGAKVNSVAKLREIVVADLYVMGHVHAPSITPFVQYEFSGDNRSVIQRDQLCIVTSGGLERGGYGVAKGYPATSMQIPIVRLDGRHKKMEPRFVSID